MHEGIPTPDASVGKDNAELLGASWLDVCRLAMTLLRPEFIEPHFAEAIVSACLADLDETHVRAGAVFDTSEAMTTNSASLSAQGAPSHE